MGILEDTMKILDRIPLWKELQTAPSRIKELEQRVANLEEKLGGKWPADVCKSCGARAVRMVSVIGPDINGNMIESWHCSECNFTEERRIKPK